MRTFILVLLPFLFMACAQKPVPLSDVNEEKVWNPSDNRYYAKNPPKSVRDAMFEQSMQEAHGEHAD